MATPLVTTQILTITNSEVTRGNNALNQAEALTVQNATLTTQNASLNSQVTSLNGQVTTLTATVAQKNARIAELEALLAQQPPPAPPPVTPTVPVPGMFVKNGKLYTKKGVEFVVRGIESMCGSDAFNAGPATWVETNKALGANTISPLWQTSQSSVERLTVWLNAMKAGGVVVGFNADHIPDGRAWLCTPAIVQLCNSYENLFLQCEVETGWGQTAQQWLDDVKGMITQLRNAGHKAPIKVGSPAGGRVPKLAVENGLQVLNHDPLKNILFTWQSYWHKVAPAGQWHYQQEAGIPVTTTDPGGAIEQCKRIRESGLCFIVGIDKEDDVGTTIYSEVITECDKYGLNVQMWVITGDFRSSNNMLGHWNQSLSSITATGTEIRDRFKVKSVLPVL